MADWTSFKKIVPPFLRPLARRVYGHTRSLLFPSKVSGADRIQNELQFFSQNAVVHALPSIAHYWSDTHLVPMLRPFGVSSSHECLRRYLGELCTSALPRHCVFLSVGSGNAEAEITMARWLREQNLDNFAFECLDLNADLLEQGRQRARECGVEDRFSFRPCNINDWSPDREYDAILALQSLHHVVKLETLLDNIRKGLSDSGYFLSDDMIGRNGHQRWPEALKLVHELWNELPDSYRNNRQLNRYEKMYQNWDCSKEGFEGIRSQDILRLLIERFHFQFFFAFGNVIDVFIDRGFGHNFDPDREWDRSFIDRAHAVDTLHLERGIISPTHMITAMRKVPVEHPLIYKHFTPEFCLRKSRFVLSRRNR